MKLIVVKYIAVTVVSVLTESKYYISNTDKFIYLVGLFSNKIY